MGTHGKLHLTKKYQNTWDYTLKLHPNQNMVPVLQTPMFYSNYDVVITNQDIFLDLEIQRGLLKSWSKKLLVKISS